MRISFFTIIAAICSPLLTHAEGRSEEIFNQLARIPSAMIAEMRYPGSVIMVHASSPATAISLFPDGIDAYNRVHSSAYMPLKNDDGTSYIGIGFIPAQNVETILTIATPPRLEMILKLAPGETSNVESTLLDFGYTIQEKFGVSAYTNGRDDFELDIANRNAMDPFSGLIGSSARVVFRDDLILSARSWPYILLLAKHSEPDWVWEPLAHAIDTADLGEAVLLQAQILPSQATLTRGAPSGIPIWNFAMLADLSDGTTDTTMALFLYQTKADAEQAAARLEEGWSEQLPVNPENVQRELKPGQDFDELMRRHQESRKSLYELTNAEPTASIYGDGPYVTALTLRKPVESDLSDMPINRTFNTILQAMNYSELSLFGPPK